MKFTKSLNQNRDFKRIYNRAKYRVHPLLVTYVYPNKLGINRMGITASTKIGNAVSRNRARRLIKEAYRLLEPELKTGFDYVFVARKTTCKSGMAQVMRVIKAHINELFKKTK